MQPSRKCFFILVLKLLLAHLSPAVSQAHDGQTDVTKALNAQIKQSPPPYSADKAYTGGKGVIIRNPYDGYENGGPHSGSGGAYEVLPCSFISNDIFASNKVFPRFDHLSTFQWDSCPIFYVVGLKMSTLMYDFDHIQQSDWGWGVFYPWDSNAVDFRCEWLDIKGTPKMYNCPGYSKQMSKRPVQDANMFGAGYFYAGNPYANNQWGGGAGCHFSGLPYGCNDPKLCTNDIDQVNRTRPGNISAAPLVQDEACQCNYAYNGDWAQWVYELGNLTSEAAKGTLPEASMCWTNNFRDMINLSNYLFWARGNWFKTGEKGDGGPSGYWGWNEIPITRDGDSGITNPANWDAVVVKMPLYVCKSTGGDDHPGCLSAAANLNLETDLTQWVKDAKMVAGLDAVTKSPGSYIVLMREWQDQNGNSFSFFFCDEWSSPNRHWEITYVPMSTASPTGVCYLTKGVGYTDSILDRTFPEPVPRSKAKAMHRAMWAQRQANVKDLVV